MLTNLELYLLNLKIKSNESTLKVFIKELEDCDILKLKILIKASLEVMNTGHNLIHSIGAEDIKIDEITAERAEIISKLSESIRQHTKTMKDLRNKVLGAVEKFK